MKLRDWVGMVVVIIASVLLGRYLFGTMETRGQMPITIEIFLYFFIGLIAISIPINVVIVTYASLFQKTECSHCHHIFKGRQTIIAGNTLGVDGFSIAHCPNCGGDTIK